MALLTCSRCKQEKEGVAKTAFYTGDVKKLLLEHACQDCWEQWIKMQIMIINEYRLNLMDPKSDEILNKQVLAFFGLDPNAEQATVEYKPPAE